MQGRIFPRACPDVRVGHVWLPLVVDEAIGRPPPIVQWYRLLSHRNLALGMPSPISPSFIRRLPSLRIAAFRQPSIRRPLPYFSKIFQQQKQSFSSTMTMDNQELVHYLADQPPSVVRLEIEKHFEALTDKQKRYAHFISK